MEIKDVLAALFKKHRTNANQLALATKVPQPTIHRIEVGEHRDPRKETLQPIADYFGITLPQLRGEAAIPGINDPSNVTPLRPMGLRNTELGPPSVGRVPLISWVQAGSFAAVVDNFAPGEAEEWVETTVPIRQHTYALRVRGDSMTNPAGEPTFPNGQVIVIEPDAIDSPDKLVGSLVIVRRQDDDEATFKKLERDGDQYLLRPLNPQYPMLQLKEGDVICGVVREKVVRFF